jgi:glycosyltransferase involved in cell wall biosynthesis
MAELKEVLHRGAVRVEALDLLQRFLRRRARPRLGRLRSGVTVVIASWNSNQFLEVGLEGVRRFADRPTEILVIDNHSDESPVRITTHFGARLLRLPANLRHSLALDIGFLLAQTEFVMSLDVDAFPYDAKWMPTFLQPLDRGFVVSGCEWFRPYAHPCCLAIRTADFVTGCFSFRAGGPCGWDVGEAISHEVGPGRTWIVPRTATIEGKGYVSASYGNVLYHNCYGTRHLRLDDPYSAGLDPTDTHVTTRQSALEIWAEALRRFGPATWS